MRIIFKLLLPLALFAGTTLYAQPEKLHFTTQLLEGGAVGELRVRSNMLLAPGNNTTWGYEIYDLNNATGAVTGSNNFIKLIDNNDFYHANPIGINSSNMLYYLGSGNGISIHSVNTNGGYQPATAREVGNIPDVAVSSDAAMAVDRLDKAWFITNYMNTADEYQVEINAYSFQSNAAGDANNITTGGRILASDLPYPLVQDIAFNENGDMIMLVSNGSPFEYNHTDLTEVTYYIYKLTEAQLADLDAGTNVTMQRMGQITRADGTPVTGNRDGAYPYNNYSAANTVLAGMAFTTAGNLLVSATEAPGEYTLAQYVFELRQTAGNFTINNTSNTDTQNLGQDDNFGFYASDLATNIFPQALPIRFGTITGKITNDNRLLLEWTSESETNNAYYEVQVSEDGTRFQALGEKVLSKAANGTSGLPLKYDFAYDLQKNISVAGLYIPLAGLLILALGSALLFRRNRPRYTARVLALTGLLMLGLGCKKDNGKEINAPGEKMYIKIKQVDTDGGHSYSRVIFVRREA